MATIHQLSNSNGSPKNLLSRPQIEELVRLANLSPNPDNSQPWSFLWDGITLSIFHYPSLSMHGLNPKLLACELTIGCLLESISIVASNWDLSSEIELQPFSDAEGACWARVRFKPISSKSHLRDPLFFELTKRTTDRRLYQGGAKELGTVFNPELAKFSEASVHVCTSLDPELMEFCLDSEELLMRHPEALANVMKWVRFSIAEARVSGNGLSWRNLLVKPWEIPAMLLFKKFPASVPKTAPLLIPQHRARTRQQLRSAAGLVCVSVPIEKGEISSEALVQGGRAMMRAWLQLSQMQMGGQPMSLVTFPMLFRRNNAMDAYFRTRLDLCERGEKILRKAFSIEENRFPLWILRTGLAKPLPDNMRTFRQTVDKILKFQDEP